MKIIRRIIFQWQKYIAIKAAIRAHEADGRKYLVMILGARSYKVTAYPLSQIHIDLKVPIANTNKAIMTCAGKWTPYWKKDEQEKK